MEKRSFFGMWEGDRFWECGGAIAVCDVKGDHCLGMWRGDRFFGDVENRELITSISTS
ncbi:MAG: hypothetical protein ACKPIG_20875 [Microcystis panniformis]